MEGGFVEGAWEHEAKERERERETDRQRERERERETTLHSDFPHLVDLAGFFTQRIKPRLCLFIFDLQNYLSAKALA